MTLSETSRWARATAATAPGRFSALVDDLPTDPRRLTEVACNVIVHYRASGEELPEASADDIHARTIEAIIGLDQSRHPEPLAQPRPIVQRVQGCCRDFTLFAVAALRAHGVPARSVVGFAGYFIDGWHHDHVVAEWWDGARWARFDPQIAGPRPGLADPTNIPSGLGGPFETAAELWNAHRHNGVDLASYGVDPTMPQLSGPALVHDYVLIQLAHREGEETLLWDSWGAMAGPGANLDDTGVVDEIAALLVAADAGDHDAEAELAERYARDARLRPGPTVRRHDPRGGEPVVVTLPVLEV